jgi:hypothetical protein
MQGDRDEEQRGLCYDQPQVWLVTVVVTLSDILPCVLRGEVGPVGKDSSSPELWRYIQRYWSARRMCRSRSCSASMQLIASFQERNICSPLLGWRSRAIDKAGAGRKMHRRMWQRGRHNAHDHCVFCSYEREVYWPPMSVFSFNISTGWGD